LQAQSRQNAKLFSSRRNWDSPNPSPAGEFVAPPPPWGRGTLAGRGGVRESQSDEGTYTVELYINMYFVIAGMEGEPGCRQ
jgi:hypothetical protein